MAQLLVIEDELVLAKNIARFFERQGHTVGLAHDGQAGVDMARAIAAIEARVKRGSIEP